MNYNDPLKGIDFEKIRSFSEIMKESESESDLKITSPMGVLVKELKENNSKLTDANDKLISVTKNQGKTQMILSVANLILVIISVFLSVATFFSDRDIRAEQLRMNTLIQQESVSSREAEKKLQNTQKDLLLLKTQYEQLKQRSDTSKQKN